MSEIPHAAPIPTTVGVPANPPVAAPARRVSRVRYAVLGLICGGLVPLLIALVIAWLGGYRYVGIDQVAPAMTAGLAPKSDLKAIEKKIAVLQPKGVYIVIDAAQNRLRLMQDDQVIREAVCSAGTGAVLKDPKSGKTWVFETPHGVRVVKNKQAHPCWRRPDWDYVENGEPMPKSNDDRLDCAALGEYALYLGDGYMIHGTLYERSLGLSVTHGCVRLGAADLEAVWKAAPVGTKVYLY